MAEINRADIDNFLNSLVGDGVTTQTKPSFIIKMVQFMNDQNYDPIVKKQILDDLESYAAFHNLGG